MIIRCTIALAFVIAACQDDSPPTLGPSDIGADTQATSDTEVVDACAGAAQLAPCDDGNPCTEDDRCFDGACVGALKTCDDENPCTKDWCEVEVGCVHEDRDKPCDDGNPCTSVDTCADGKCVGKPVSNAVCDDDNLCTINDVCTNGVCAGETQLCNDFNPCTKDFCDTEHPQADDFFCVHEWITSICDDLNECTLNDTCARGQCIGQVEVDKPCSDGSLCTDDGKCQADGSCIGSGKVCTDENPCTLDTCQPDGGCLFTPEVGAICDDGDKCTIQDLCDAEGACVGGTKCLPTTPCEEVGCIAETGACTVAPKDCDDDNICTEEVCKTTIGCVYTDVPGVCDDDDLCTFNDHCQEGDCEGATTKCDVANDTACEANLCDPGDGDCKMTHLDGEPCDDDTPCTESDVCSKGACVGIPKVCGDGDPCTEDWCIPGTGDCEHEPYPDGCEDLAWERSNAYRNLMGLDLLENNEFIKNAALAHCKYYVQHYLEVYKEGGLSPHNEAQGYDGFTGEGFGARMATAGFTDEMGWPMFEVMHFIYDEQKSVDDWMASLYHRIPFTVPIAKSMGYGGSAKASTSKCDTIDFAGGDGKPTYENLIIPFPIDGMQGVPVDWYGNENPQPPLPAGEQYPSGPIITVTFGSASGFAGVALNESEIVDSEGTLIPHVANDAQTDPDLCCGVVTLYSYVPLDTFTTYTVWISYSKNGVAGTFEWSFTTGDGSSTFYLP